MTEVLYVIARKYYGKADDCDFVSELAHEFAGKDEVIGYTYLKGALQFNSEEDAENVLSAQPDWVQRKHVVIPVNTNILGECWL